MLVTAVAAKKSDSDRDYFPLFVEYREKKYAAGMIPGGYFKTMHNPAFDWCYLTEPDPGIVDRRLQWPRGKVLGGSSSINAMCYCRGHRKDYDAWTPE